MKYILLLFTAFALSSCATLIPNEIENGKLLGIMPMQHGRVSYQYVFKTQADRESIFRQARRWAAFRMTNPSSVLTVSDNLLGDIISRGGIGTRVIRLKNEVIYINLVDYAISIEAMDAQYRVTLTNFYHNREFLPSGIEFRSSAVPKKNEREWIKRMDEQIINIINELDSFVNDEVKGVKP